MKWENVAMFVVWTVFTWVAGVSMGVTATIVAPIKMRQMLKAVQQIERGSLHR